MKSKKPAKTKTAQSLGSPEIAQIEQLIRFMGEHNLEEFEYSRGDVSIRLRKPSSALLAAQVLPPQQVLMAPVSPGSVAHSHTAPLAPTSAEAKPAEDLHIVKSPIVG